MSHSESEAARRAIEEFLAGVGPAAEVFRARLANSGQWLDRANALCDVTISIRPRKPNAPGYTLSFTTIDLTCQVSEPPRIDMPEPTSRGLMLPEPPRSIDLHCEFLTPTARCVVAPNDTATSD
jgi:hypothetical protein